MNRKFLSATKAISGAWARRAAAVMVGASVLAAAGVATTARAQTAAETAAFRGFINGLKREAVAEGISQATVDRAFRGVKLDMKVVAADRNQPEFSIPVWRYIERAVSDTRVANGLKARARVDGALQRIEEQFGAPASVMAAFWGLESNYGGFKGEYDVIRALSTLIFEGRRARVFRPHLMAALRIMDEGHAGDTRLMGSWAGAMGHTQFMPRLFLDYAVDFNGDGRKNIWGDDPTDALASTANYLRGFDWRTGEPAFLHIRVPDNFDYGANVEKRRSTIEWSTLGVTRADGSALPWGLEGAELLLPAGAKGAAFLTLANFRVIKRYNPSSSYALAVALLAERLDGKPARRFEWPRDDRPLTRAERYEMQERLTGIGFDTKGVDGILGRNSRAALRAFQAANGLTADGYPSAVALETLRKASPNVTPQARPRRTSSSLAILPSTEDIGPEKVAEIQQLLNQLGFDVGKVDGKAGPKTISALAEAVSSLKLDTPAAPSEAVLQALQRAAQDG